MLTINEIFHSIQGESTHAGRPCVFVRLTACDLRCRWCDTPYAFHEGRKMSVDEVMADVEARGCPVVEVTDTKIVVQKDKEKWEIARTAQTKTNGTPKVGDKVTVYYTMTASSIEVKPGKAEATEKEAPAKK